MSPPSGRARVRAALIAVVLGINLLTALPKPMKLDERRLQRPDAAEELSDWVGVAQSLGLPLTEERAARLAIDVTDGWIVARNTLITRPTRPLRKWLGIRQNWALFARPDTYPSYLIVETRQAGQWTEVFRSLHPEHDRHVGVLRYRRVRGLYDLAGPPGAATRNVYRWVADRLLAEEPGIDAVRVRTLRIHTVRPGETEDPTQKVVHDVLFEREGAP